MYIILFVLDGKLTRYEVFEGKEDYENTVELAVEDNWFVYKYGAVDGITIVSGQTGEKMCPLFERQQGPFHRD